MPGIVHTGGVTVCLFKATSPSNTMHPFLQINITVHNDIHVCQMSGTNIALSLSTLPSLTPHKDFTSMVKAFTVTPSLLKPCNVLPISTTQALFFFLYVQGPQAYT